MVERFELFVSGITMCYKYIQRIKAVEMTEFGLKGAHAMCLFFLYEEPQGLTATELCRLCNEDKAAISRTLSTLREKGCIRSEGNAYRAKWLLTEQGRRVTERVRELAGQWVGFGGEGLTDQERETFYKALEHISDNLRKCYEGMEQQEA